ncbi:hypothetical protein, partial [Phascolarctobacterium faecium]
MYKFLTVILLSWLWILPAAAAEPQEEQAVDPWAFELSVQPKKTEAELEAERWTLLMSSETGNYLFEYDSIKPVEDAEGNKSKNERQVLMRTVFKDTKVLEQLNKNYAAKLETGEQAAYCDMLLVFDLRKQLYKTVQTKVYTGEGRIIDERSG